VSRSGGGGGWGERGEGQKCRDFFFPSFFPTHFSPAMLSSRSRKKRRGGGFSISVCLYIFVFVCLYSLTYAGVC
jgi:hypothetical protein